MRVAASSLIAGIWRPVRYEHSSALSGCWPFEFLTVRSQPAKSKKLWRSCFWVLRNQSCLYLYTSVYSCTFCAQEGYIPRERYMSYKRIHQLLLEGLSTFGFHIGGFQANFGPITHRSYVAEGFEGARMTECPP